jgi:phage-related protein
VSERDLKPVHWVASSRVDLKAFPEAIQSAVGYALFRAQEGKKARRLPQPSLFGVS